MPLFVQVLRYIQSRPEGSGDGVSLDAFPTVLDLVRNPFVLRLFVEALPGLSEDDKQHLTRYTVYNVFVTQWFKREIGRLSAGDKQALGLVDATGTTLLSIDDVVSRFDLLAALLAYRPSPGPGRAPGPPICPTPAADCPGFGGWCGARSLSSWARSGPGLGCQ